MKKVGLASLGLALVVVVVYLTLMTAKVASGVSLTVDTPEHVVRLRVLDAGAGQAGEIAERIKPYLKNDFELRVVEIAEFEGRALPHSMVIAHDDNQQAAEALAQRLGFDPDEVVLRALPYNQIQASATLVAGLDFDSLLSQVSEPEED